MMKKLFVAASLFLMSVSAWGQSSLVADYGRPAPIEDCISAMKHRDAIKVRDAGWDYSSMQRYFYVVTTLLLRPTNGLDAGYYNLIHEYSDFDPVETYCGHFPFK